MVKKRKTFHHGDAKEALVETTIQLITETGSTDFSLREAARRIGIDPAAVYRHFRNREALLLEVARRAFTEMGEQMHLASDSKNPLTAIGTAYVQFAIENPERFRLMFGDAGVPARDPKMRPETMTESPFELLQRTIEESGTAQNALLLWAGVHGIARLVIDGAIELPRKEVEQLVDALVGDS